jgi:serine/threonine protein kinase
LVENGYTCHITDLGLSKPISETETENTICGLMPYIAPEVLIGQPYTQKSDIYSLGMVLYELITCLPPYAEQAHDTNLALKIIRGERPQFPSQVKYPQILVDLIK